MYRKTPSIFTMLLAAVFLCACTATAGASSDTPLPVENSVGASGAAPGSTGGLSEKDALDLLTEALSERLTEGMAILPDGEDTVNGQHAWLFAFGDDSADKLTAEAHYAVTDAGEILELDILSYEYKPMG